MKRLASSQAFGQLALLAVTPLLTRIYTPADIGLFQVAFVIGILFGPVLTLKVDAFIPGLREELRRSLAFVATLLSVTVGSVALILLVATLMSDAPPDFLVTTATALVLASVMGISAVDNALLVSEHLTNRLALRNLVAGVLAAAMQVVGGLLVPSMLTLALSLAAGRCIAVLATRRRARGVRRSPTRVAFREIGIKNAWFATLSAVVGSLSPQLGLLAVSLGAGPASAGQFALASRAAGGPVTMLGQGLSQHFSMRLADVVRAQRSGAWILVRSQLRLLIPTGVAVSLLLVVFGVWGFEAVFGYGWREAGTMTAIMAPAMCMQLALGPLSAGFPLLGRQRLHFYLEVSKSCMGLALLLTFIVAGMESAIAITVVFSLFVFVGHGAFLVAIRNAAKKWDRDHAEK